jgi:hypothetical protein
MPRPKLVLEGIAIGRDRFFGVLREKGLPPEPLLAVPRATDSRYSLPVFHNPVKAGQKHLLSTQGRDTKIR